MTTWKITWVDGGFMKSMTVTGQLQFVLSIVQGRNAWDYNIISIERVAEVQT